MVDYCSFEIAEILDSGLIMDISAREVGDVIRYTRGQLYAIRRTMNSPDVLLSNLRELGILRYRGKEVVVAKRTHIRSNLISLDSTCEIQGLNKSTYVDGYTNHPIHNQQVKLRSNILIRPTFTRINEKPNTFKQPRSPNKIKIRGQCRSNLIAINCCNNQVLSNADRIDLEKT